MGVYVGTIVNGYLRCLLHHNRIRTTQLQHKRLFHVKLTLQQSVCVVRTSQCVACHHFSVQDSYHATLLQPVLLSLIQRHLIGASQHSFAWLILTFVLRWLFYNVVVSVIFDDLNNMILAAVTNYYYCCCCYFFLLTEFCSTGMVSEIKRKHNNDRRQQHSSSDGEQEGDDEDAWQEDAGVNTELKKTASTEITYL